VSDAFHISHLTYEGFGEMTNSQSLAANIPSLVEAIDIASAYIDRVSV
jgi:hypothetical protein